MDFVAAANRLEALCRGISDWLGQDVPDSVYWIERAVGRGRMRITLSAAPIDVGPILRENLFSKVPSVIMTSATLATGGRQSQPSFEFFQSRIGLGEGKKGLSRERPHERSGWAARSIIAGRRRLVLLDGMPDPGADGPRYERAAVEMIRRYVARSDGRAFVLFTSYEMMKRAAAALTAWLAEQNLALYCQAEGTAAEPDAGTVQGQSRGRCCSAWTVFGRGWTCRATRCRT